MSWTSLSNRLDNLPLVLCGPMVRRVENDSVSVWVALKDAATVQLRVYTTQLSGIPELTASASTIQLGQHLHVALVTAKAPNDGARLDDGRIYYYDLKFGLNSTLGTPPVGFAAGRLGEIQIVDIGRWRDEGGIYRRDGMP